MEGKRVLPLLAVLALALGTVACTPDDDPPLGEPGGIEVHDVGWAHLEERVGAAAHLRNTREDAVGVAVRAVFLDEAEAEVFSADGSIPRCEPNADCWWAQTYPAADVPVARVRSVRVEIVGTTTPPDTATVHVPVRRDSDQDIVSQDLEQGGLVFVLGFDEHGLRWGMSTHVEDGARLLVPVVLLPSLGPEERLEAFLHQGAPLPE